MTRPAETAPAAHRAIPADVIAALRGSPVPTLNAVMIKAGLGSGHMRRVAPVGKARRFAGRAVTLRAIPVRADLRRKVASGELPNLQMRAFEEVGPGDVLVIDALGDLRAAVFGDIMATCAALRGAAAIVLDGVVSDPEGIAALSLPVFARGSAAVPASTLLHFTEAGGAIGCDGVAVLPGDVLVGDGNGVVVIPSAEAEAVAAAASEREALEAFVLERLHAGAPLTGLYPPDEGTWAAFRDWRAARG